MDKLPGSQRLEGNEPGWVCIPTEKFCDQNVDCPGNADDEPPNCGKLKMNILIAMLLIMQ